MLKDVREHCNHLIIWLRPDINKALYVHWEIDEGFKRHRLTNRANKTLARSSKYTGGSPTFIMKTKVRLSIGDDNNTSATSVVDPDQVWHEAASEPYKNRVYGLRSFFADNFCMSTLKHSSVSSTSRPVDPEDGIDLREQAGVEAGVRAVSADGMTHGAVRRSNARWWHHRRWKGIDITAKATASAAGLAGR
ncbi:hypothetical protein Ahy_B03g066543 [Arachis hypogaea]|uniref:Uncharacterized protein n=1 Tax=Arachis hypogaea TaxID=3818 RepID=A0A445A487_ARAHY|nr:hypothetical protein Ahy_B03g066543 [Arachis hypogaea]